MRAALLLLVAQLLAAGDPAPAGADSSAPVSLRGQALFVLQGNAGTAPPADRARAAEGILTQVLDEPSPETTVSVSPLQSDGGETEFDLQVDGKELLRLGPEDARPSGLSAAIYARQIASTIQVALTHERRRLARQHLLQAIAMTVFLGLLTFLALRWVTDAGRHARLLVEQRLAKVHGLRVRQVVVVSPETLEGTSYALVGIGRTALQLAILYAYVVFALSQFAATRGAIAPLTRALTAPFGALLGHVLDWVPAALLLAVAIYLLRGALHLSGFLLDRVASGEFQWRWLPRELAGPAKPLVRAGLVIGVALIFGPLTGQGSDALLTRLGLLALLAVGLALVPAMAAGALGTFALFGRRYRIGEWVAIGDHTGEVIEVGFLDLTLVPVEAGRTRISHLVMLWTPVRHLPATPATEIEVPVDLSADPSHVLEILSGAFESSRRPEISLREVTPAAALYRLRFPAGAPMSSGLPDALAALSKAGLIAGARRS